MTRSRIALATLVALAMSCSVVTSLDGLAGGAASPGGDDAGASASDASGSVDASDAPSTKPRAWRLVQVSGPPAIHSARMAFDEARQKTVLYGGGGPNATTDTWEWDGMTWARVRLPTTPGERNAPAVAYDSARQLTMLYAGSNGTPDPWEWDGSAWRSSGVSASSPKVAHGSAMAYDRARDVLVIFGGLRAGTGDDSDETWEWSAKTGFSNRKPAVAPPARHAHVVVYDAARARTVVFGGADSALESDLWEWDGTSWTQRMPPLSPPARRAACATYDSVRNVVVVFGGRGSSGETSFADTWEWDGTSWRQGPLGPAGRSSCAMAFDKTRNAVVMFGGSPRKLSKQESESVAETWVYE